MFQVVVAAELVELGTMMMVVVEEHNPSRWQVVSDTLRGPGN